MARLSFVIGLGAFVALFLFTGTAVAHEHATFGTYQTTLGWAIEPPNVDQPNAIELRVEGADKLASPLLAKGAKFQWTFMNVGEFAYHCHPHPWMMGNVTVEAHADHSHGTAGKTHTVKIVDGATAGEYKYVPENLTVHVGDTIVWVNEGTMGHTVTAKTSDHAHGGHADAGERMEMHKEATNESAPHGHGALVPISGLAGQFEAKISIGGKEKTLTFRPKFGSPGMYKADITPTVAGTYALHFTGKFWAQEFDYKVEPQTVVAGSANQFPETTKTAFELSRDVARLQEEITALKAKTQTSGGDVKDVDTNDAKATPFPTLLVIVGIVAVGVALRRRTRA